MSKKRSQRDTKKFLKGLKAKRQKFSNGGYGGAGTGQGQTGVRQIPLHLPRPDFGDFDAEDDPFEPSDYTDQGGGGYGNGNGSGSGMSVGTYGFTTNISAPTGYGSSSGNGGNGNSDGYGSRNRAPIEPEPEEEKTPEEQNDEMPDTSVAEEEFKGGEDSATGDGTSDPDSAGGGGGGEGEGGDEVAPPPIKPPVEEEEKPTTTGTGNTGSGTGGTSNTGSGNTGTGTGGKIAPEKLGEIVKANPDGSIPEGFTDTGRTYTDATGKVWRLTVKGATGADDPRIDQVFTQGFQTQADGTVYNITFDQAAPVGSEGPPEPANFDKTYTSRGGATYTKEDLMRLTGGDKDKLQELEDSGYFTSIDGETWKAPVTTASEPEFGYNADGSPNFSDVDLGGDFSGGPSEETLALEDSDNTWQGKVWDAAKGIFVKTVVGAAVGAAIGDYYGFSKTMLAKLMGKEAFKGAIVDEATGAILDIATGLPIVGAPLQAILDFRDGVKDIPADIWNSISPSSTTMLDTSAWTTNTNIGYDSSGNIQLGSGAAWAGTVSNGAGTASSDNPIVTGGTVHESTGTVLPEEEEIEDLEVTEDEEEEDSNTDSSFRRFKSWWDKWR